MVLVRGDLPEHAALSQCSHCRNVNNENKAKREKKREREGEGEGAYMLGELRNKVRSVSARRLFPSADSSCAVSPSKLFSSRGTREEKRVRPEKVKSPPKKKKCERDPTANHFLFINVSNRGADQLFTPARCRNVRS